MRRASVLVAVTAVSVVIMSACTSFPQLTLEDGLTGADGSPGDDGDGDGGDASRPTGGDSGGATGSDASPSGGVDGSTAGKDAAMTMDATTAKDSAPADAAKADTGPDPCASSPLDCSVAANASCSQCKTNCVTSQGADVCGSSTPNCCASEDGQSANYKVCCYNPGGIPFDFYPTGSCSSNCVGK